MITYEIWKKAKEPVYIYTKGLSFIEVPTAYPVLFNDGRTKLILAIISCYDNALKKSYTPMRLSCPVTGRGLGEFGSWGHCQRKEIVKAFLAKIPTAIETVKKLRTSIIMDYYTPNGQEWRKWEL